jgi:hypothetical protein
MAATYSAYTILVYPSMAELITAVAALLSTQNPIGAPFPDHEGNWCQAMGTFI